jgi:hypothetical protein
VRKADWRARARYAFDNLMAKGTPALVGLLGLASAALVLVIASLAWLLAPADASKRTATGPACSGERCCAPWIPARWAATRVARSTCC